MTYFKHITTLSILIFVFVFYQYNIITAESNLYLAPLYSKLKYSPSDYNRVVKDIGNKNILLKKLLFENPENQRVLEALLEDSSLIPVFMISLPGRSDEIDIINQMLFEQMGEHFFINEFNSFVVGDSKIAEKLLAKKKTKILIGVKDRPSNNNVIPEYEISNNRQTFFPLKTGFWLGIGGSGIAIKNMPPFYIQGDKKSFEAQKYQGVIMSEKIHFDYLEEITQMKVQGHYFPQIIACKKIFDIPDGKGGYISTIKNKLNAHLVFQLHLTPHRFNHFHQIVANDPTLENIIIKFNKSWKLVNPKFIDVKNPKEYFNFVLKKWAKYRAALINIGFDKTTFHIQDMEIFGNIADDIEEDLIGKRYGPEMKLKFHILNIFTIIHNLDVITAISPALGSSNEEIIDYIRTFFETYFSELQDNDIKDYWEDSFSNDDELYLWAKNIINTLVIQDFEKNENLKWPKNTEQENEIINTIKSISLKTRNKQANSNNDIEQTTIDFLKQCA